MTGICELLDSHDPAKPYSGALQLQLEKIAHPDRTPSARMLEEMRENGESFLILHSGYRSSIIAISTAFP